MTGTNPQVSTMHARPETTTVQRNWRGLACLLLLSFSGSNSMAVLAADGFDHFPTGFPLDGQHQHYECQVCHVNGVFSGTPTE